LAICQEIDNKRNELSALSNLGGVSFALGDYAAGLDYTEQALAISREIGDRLIEGAVLNNLGEIASFQGDYATARRYYEQALAICREVGDRQGEGVALNTLGAVVFSQGNYAAARGYSERALAICREIGDRQGEPFVLHNLGAVAFAQGDAATAYRYYEQALLVSRELDQTLSIAKHMVGLAQAALAQGDPARARAHILEMLPLLEPGLTVGGAECSTHALLGCVQVLQSLNDPHGYDILVAAHARLQEQAAQIADEAARRMFLEDVPAHRELAAEFARLTTGQAAPAVETTARPPAAMVEGDRLPVRTGKKGKGREREGGKRGKKKKKGP
jgi:tetratricopeptide (TPR) repeat protein